jgi:methylaspartate mutase epsilon subunit
MQTSLSRYASGAPLIQPRGGRTTQAKQSQLWSALESAGCDLLPLTIDSKTRLGQIELASTAYQNSLISGLETLNGFPLLSVDVKIAKELIDSANLPVSLRHGTPYAFDLIKRAVEIGITEIEGGPLSYCLPYSRDTDLVRVINSWKEAELVCSKSQDTVVRETFGILTACLVPPIVSVLVNALECAFIETFKGGTPMASFGATGSDYQDAAAVESFRLVYPWLKERLQLPESDFLVAFHHWMGPFPKNKELAESIIVSGTQLAVLIGANKVVTKTVDEALGVPTDDSNAAGVRLTKSVLEESLSLLEIVPALSKSEEDVSLIVKECKIQLEKLLERTSDICEILFDAVKTGLIDPPFAPHRACRGNLKSLRAIDGSVRITTDFPGVFSEGFIQFERKVLDLKCMWANVSSDEVKLDLQYPFTARKN